MDNLRHRDFDKSTPYEVYLAADARLSRTDYTDDQVWDIVPGSGDSPALALQTQYGGRAGLASLIPMWMHEGRLIYQAQTYHDVPCIQAFAPGYILAEGAVLPGVPLRLEHIALDSHSIGGLYTVQNTTKRAVTLRFEMFGHVGARGDEQKLAIVTLAGGGHALSMGMLKGISAVVLLEKGRASQISHASASPKIGTSFTLEPGTELALRWVHIGKREIRDSLATGRRWLNVDWQPFFDSIDAAAQAIPIIQTSNLAWDAVLTSAYNRVVQSFLRPAGIFPRETYVAGRLPRYGFSWKGNGSDHPRMWDGQDVALAYLILPVLASIAPTAAEGALRNFIAVQKQSGYIDLKPGAAGQQQQLLCTPLLARIAWNIYLYTENNTFIADIYPALQRFFEFWLSQDADNDGLPEWSDDRQTHYVAFPTFGPGMVWSQGADIAKVETPDLLTYLISEAEHLAQIADLLDKSGDADTFQGFAADLRQALNDFWEGDHYAYRDRDTHITTSGMMLLNDGAGDAEHRLEQALAAPNRLIISVVGGISHVPRITMTVEGLDRDGNPVTETIPTEKFRWQNRQGIYTTDTVFSQVDCIQCEGLSRVYRIFARTLDTTALDLNSLLPLWAGGLEDDKASALAKLALSKKHFLRRNGLTMTDAQGDDYDPTSAEGAGGAWLYFQTLLGEGLLKAGYGNQVTEMTKQTLDVLADVLADDRAVSQFYHSEKAAGLGENGHLAGIAPLHLLMQLFGVRIVSHDKVYIGGAFAWGRGVTIRQHGVYVRRTTKRIKVEFASGHVVELPPDADWQAVTDPNPVTPPKIQPIALPERVDSVVRSAKPERQPTLDNPSPMSPGLDAPPAAERIIIEVERED